MEINSKIEAAKAAQRDYYKEWRAKNKDKVKQYNLNYWSKKAQKNRAADSSSDK